MSGRPAAVSSASGPDISALTAQLVPVDAGRTGLIGHNGLAGTYLIVPEVFADGSRIDVFKALATALNLKLAPADSNPEPCG